MNLVVNARDAMPDGGQITLKTANIELDKNQCKYMPEAREGRFVCLSVEDTGIGIDGKILPDIFDPFFSTKGPGKGTGLGLSVVYGIIKQHEGWVHVSSKVGEGTIFYIYFPAEFNQSVDEKKTVCPEKTEKSGGKRILYIEDEEKVRSFTAKALRRGGYVIFEAATAEEAFNAFEREEGEFHLVVSDVVLPDQSGVDLVEKILVKKPKLPVLLCSGYTDHKASWDTIKAKGFPFLQKPYSVNDILKVIQELAA
jgi:CheY-like chemotaxis protein